MTVAKFINISKITMYRSQLSYFKYSANTLAYSIKNCLQVLMMEYINLFPLFRISLMTTLQVSTPPRDWNSDSFSCAASSEGGTRMGFLRRKWQEKFKNMGRMPWNKSNSKYPGYISGEVNPRVLVSSVTFSLWGSHVGLSFPSLLLRAALTSLFLRL